MFWPSMFFDCADVVGKRTRKISQGGVDAIAESSLMVAEKMFAAVDAGLIIASGGSGDDVVRRYRKLVRANVRRLK